MAERRPPAAAKPGRDARADGDAKGEGPADDLLRKVNRLKDEVIGDAAKAAVKERLGLGGDEEPVRVHGATKRPQKDLRVGAGLGLVAGQHRDSRAFAQPARGEDRQRALGQGLRALVAQADGAALD